jgi:tRNA nucleotidyltransferase (CCA-adding enzyme)
MKIPDHIMQVCKTLSDAGHQVVLVGGCVRDSVLGREPHDFDVATGAMPYRVIALFDKTIPTGIKHGTVTVMMGEEAVEVTTFRSEAGYADGRHPDAVVLGVPLEVDLQRRDFCMNALAYDPFTDVIIDPFEGLHDIMDKVIKCVGDPNDRFSEDALRMMRCARFASQLGFDVDLFTLTALNANAHKLMNVSMERIRDELLKTLASPDPSRGLRLMVDSGLTAWFMPELDAMIGIAQNKHHIHNLFDHVMVVVNETIGDPILRFAALMHDMGKPSTMTTKENGDIQFLGHEDVGAVMTKNICERLKMSTEDTNRVVLLVSRHMEPHHLAQNATLAAVRRLVRRVGVDRMGDLMALADADSIGSGHPKEEHADLVEKIQLVLNEKPVVNTKLLAISGNDVMQFLGLKPGPQVGKILASLLERVTDDPALNTRDNLLSICNILVSKE